MVPHRPYEGQQHVMDPFDPLIAASSSSPLRGAATSLRPSETREPQSSSSPLRGAATSANRGRCRCAPAFLIAPTRGSNRLPSSWRTVIRNVPHRPYEGQQQGEPTATEPAADSSSSPLRGAATCPRGGRGKPLHQFLIAPTRGSNMLDQVARCRLISFLIAPTRGSNTRRRRNWNGPPLVPHRPYEGQQQGEPTATEPAADSSSSPLRGAATSSIPMKQVW